MSKDSPTLDDFKIAVAESALAQVKISDDKYDAILTLESWIKKMKEENL